MIHADSLTKTFGSFKALDNVSLHVPEGRLVALLGPSGSGKTTLLRILAGLEFPDSGHVRLDGRDATHTKARDRRIGFVFQHYALFRHMKVADNVAFGLTAKPRGQRPSRAEISERVERLLNLVRLEGLGGRYPTQLSGGQRQRVALARALAVEPRLLLLDEPFGALDAQVRKELRQWLRGLFDELGLTGVFVTHDQEEALEVADEVVVMNKGRIEQSGSPEAIYDRPATAFVYRFLGGVNELPADVLRSPAVLPSTLVEADDKSQGARTAFVRPHDVVLGATGIAARVRQVMAVGATVRVTAELEGGLLVEAEIPREERARLSLAPGASVAVGFRTVRVLAES